MSILKLLTRENLARVEKYMPVVETAGRIFQDMRADELTTDHIGMIFDMLDVKVDPSGFQPYIDMIPRFVDSPDEGLKEFVTGGGLKRMFEFTAAGRPSDQISTCPVCKTNYFHLHGVKPVATSD